MMTYPNFYYEEIKGRLQGIVIAVAKDLPGHRVQVVTDYIDHNELGLGLESLTEAIRDSHHPVGNDTIEELCSLCAKMDMDYDVRSTLEPPE